MGFRFKIRNIKKRYKKEFDRDFINSLSPRARTICENHDFYNIKCLKKFIDSGRDFNQLRNCGTKTFDELHAVLNTSFKHRQKEFRKENKSNENLIVITQKIINNDLKNQILLNLSEPLFKTLSSRAKNSICWMCKSFKPNIEKFIIKSIVEDFDYNKIRNVGKKTIEELKNLKTRIVNIVLDINDEKITAEDLLENHDIKSKAQNVFDHYYNKQVLFFLIESFIETLSARAKNSICWMCDTTNPNIEKFIIKSKIQ